MTTTYPDQLMLPGQAAAPGGPVDMKVMYLMHHAFRRDLARFAEAVPATPVEDRPTWTALAQRWRRFAEILHHHHTGEDAGIWPWLLERADEAERQTLLDMEAEHEKIDPLLRACDELFAALAGEPGAAADAAAGRSREELRAGLSVRLTEASELLGGHLRHEESEAMVILQRYMTPGDWTAIEAEHFQGKDDLKFLLYVVPWLGHGLDRPTFDRVIAEAGLPMRVLHLVGRRRFRRLEDRAFRHRPA